MCPHTTMYMCVLILLYMCPHICVLISETSISGAQSRERLHSVTYADVC
jgi:hypothetical protein